MNGLLSKFKRKIKEFQEIEHQEKIESQTICKDNLKLYFDDKNKVRLFYKKKELTKYFGFSIKVLSDALWYYSANSDSIIEKISPQEIKITLSLRDLSLNQFWNIKINPEGILTWDVDLELKEPLRIDRINVGLFLSRVYKDWVIPPINGQFPADFNNEWQVINPPENNNPDFVGVYSSFEDVPGIVFRHSKNRRAQLLVSNTDINLSSRVLEAQLAEEKELYKPGVYPYIKATIEIYPDKFVFENMLNTMKEEHRRRQEELKEAEQRRQEEIREEDRKQRTMQKGYFRLYLDSQNHVHIYYKDNEFTKGCGLNTAIFSEENWYSLLDSKAVIERPSPDEMIVNFTHNQLPITQVWYLRFTPESILDWDVDIQLKASMRIDRRKASLFLSRVYKEWLAPPLEGRFPEYFEYKWLIINSARDNNPEFIGAVSSLKDVPSIVFKNSIDVKSSLIIQNSDIRISSRVLEEQIEEENEFYRPGFYSFFKVVIKFYPDKSVLKNVFGSAGEKEKIKSQKEHQSQLLKKPKITEALQILKPSNYVLVMVDTCMLKCKMCYQWKSFNRPGELTIEEWKEIVTYLNNFSERQSHIYLVGGEPLIKEGILELVKHISEQGGKFVSEIVTNGVLVDDAMAKKIIESGLSTIILSLDSLKPEIHDYLRGSKGCYVKIIEAIDSINRYRSVLHKHIDIGIQSIILEQNTNELVKLAKWVQEDERIQFISFQVLKQPLNSLKNKQWYKNKRFRFLWPKDLCSVIENIDAIIRLKDEGNNKISNEISQLEFYKAYYQNPEVMIKDVRCNIFNDVIIVDPVGNISFCSHTGNIGNVREAPLALLWNSRKADEVRNKILSCKNICRHLALNYNYDTPKIGIK